MKTDPPPLNERIGRFFINFAFYGYMALVYLGTFANGGISYLGSFETLAFLSVFFIGLMSLSAFFPYVAIVFAITSALICWGLETQCAIEGLQEKRKNALIKWQERINHPDRTSAQKIKSFLPHFTFFIPDFFLKILLFIYTKSSKKPPSFLKTERLNERSWLEVTLGFFVMWFAPFAIGVEFFMGGIPIMYSLGLALSEVGGLLPGGFVICSMLFVISATQNFFLDVPTANDMLRQGISGIVKSIVETTKKEVEINEEVLSPFILPDEVSLKKTRNRGFFERWSPVTLGFIVVMIGPLVAAGTAYWGFITIFAGPWVMPVAILTCMTIGIENLSLETAESVKFIQQCGKSFDEYIQNIWQATTFYKGLCALLPSWQRFIPDILLKLIYAISGYPRTGSFLNKSFLVALLGPMIVMIAPIAYGTDAFWSVQMLLSGIILGASLAGTATFPPLIIAFCAISFAVAFIQCRSLEVQSTCQQLNNAGLKIERKIAAFFRPQKNEESGTAYLCLQDICASKNAASSKEALDTLDEIDYHYLSTFPFSCSFAIEGVEVPLNYTKEVNHVCLRA